jgi:hypothetical protein
MKEQPYKYMVRLPPQMRDLIFESAQHYRRSMNSDIVARLHQSFSGLPDDSTERALAPPLHAEFGGQRGRGLSDEEAQLLRSFRRLGKDKRAALLDLLN